jgi:hypothetical protein
MKHGEGILLMQIFLYNGKNEQFSTAAQQQGNRAGIQGEGGKFSPGTDR